MKKAEKKRLFKCAIATYLSILAVFLFQFRLTLCIAFSAIFVILYNQTRRSSLRYALRRMLVQIIGVSCGGSLYILITSKYLCFLPESQRFPLAMTIGLVAGILLKHWLHLDVTDVSAFTPIVLTLLMMPSNQSYPVFRLIQCTIGVTIGCIINIFIFPVPDGSQADIERKLQRESELLMEFMEDFTATLSLHNVALPKMKEVLAIDAEITHSLASIKPRPGSKDKTTLGRWIYLQETHSLNQMFLYMMQQVSAVTPYDCDDECLFELKMLVEKLFYIYQNFSIQGKKPTENDIYILLDIDKETYKILFCKHELITCCRKMLVIAEKDMDNICI